MKSGKSFFQFPFVIIRRRKYQELIATEVKAKSLQREIAIIKPALNHWKEVARTFEKQLTDINLKRNAKGQFERRDNV